MNKYTIAFMEHESKLITSSINCNQISGGWNAVERALEKILGSVSP